MRVFLGEISGHLDEKNVSKNHQHGLTKVWELPAGSDSGCSTQETPSSKPCSDHGELCWLQRSCWEHWVASGHPSSPLKVSLGSLEPL
ncbi:hypothetical protein QYF61_010311 [Mycteria americana]|uniref:Uncharacterized protein n=1 Tax=Mycteria americana TaxID=33587 RepID=A0AAN7RJ56_MYCAM|nr:hypothetical protein QYF61_010311 [Mycteria americana]